MADNAQQWVVAAEYDTAPPACIAAGMLEANGIEAHVDYQNMTTIYGAGATWAPVKLLVRAADARKAAGLLNGHRD